MDDLQRRDFTCNAIAKDEDGNFIDPFDGRKAIAEQRISAVGNAFDRLNEDALRAVRALRFSVTKGFFIDDEVRFAMESSAVLEKIRTRISDERIKDELSKMLHFDTVASIIAFNEFPALTKAMFSGRVSLDSTLKTKGRR
jgi:tRNA nucleotidyltransferase (CCA-adding enzyme)